MDSNRNLKVAVQYVLSAIRPTKLRNRLIENMELVQKDMKKDLTKIFDHARMLSIAYVLMHSGTLDEESTSENDQKQNNENNNRNKNKKLWTLRKR